MSDEIGMPPIGRASGWYPSPNTYGYGEYWDGTRWTGVVRADTSVTKDSPRPTPPPPPPTVASRKWYALGLSTWLGIVFAFLWLLLWLVSAGMPGVLVGAATLALVTAMYAILSGRKSWLRIPSRKAAGFVLAGALVTAMIGGGVAPHPAGPDPSAGGYADGQGTAPTTPATPTADPSTGGRATPAPSPRPTAPKPSPTASKPVVVTKNETAVEDVPFPQTTVNDATLAAGTTQVTTAGVPGKRTITYRVTLTDGVETARVVLRTIVTQQPVAQVTANGTYVAPPAPVAAPAPSGCDPNYGGCVPIDSDVDCGGGSGNGPSYLYDTVPVIGSDIYDLDRDNDGIACD